MSCRADLVYSGDSRVAALHLDRMKRECRGSILRNTSLWEREKGNDYLSPPRKIADSLCLNDCTGNGLCNRGTNKINLIISYCNIIDPLGRLTVTPGGDHYFHTWCPSVRPHFSKQILIANWSGRGDH